MLSSIDALPEVVNSLNVLNVAILLRGGIMRGSDIFKALALSATAVGVGKPILLVSCRLRTMIHKHVQYAPHRARKCDSFICMSINIRYHIMSDLQTPSFRL